MDDGLFLVEVPSDELDNYLNDLKNDLPTSLVPCNYIPVLKKWKKQRPSITMSVLAPNGDPRLGLVFFYHDVSLTSYLNASVYASDSKTALILEKAIQNTRSKDPEKFPFLEMKLLLVCLTLVSYSSIAKLLPGNIHNKAHDKHNVFWMPWCLAREVEVHVPEGVEIRQLSVEHATIINNVWPHKHDGSDKLFEEIIKLNISVGVFRGDTLLSWALLWFYGALGAVQTIEGEKKKGYGRAAVQTITKKIGEMEMDVYANVLGNNVVSEAFFRSLGFQLAHEAVWFDS